MWISMWIRLLDFCIVDFCYQNVQEAYKFFHINFVLSISVIKMYKERIKISYKNFCYQNVQEAISVIKMYKEICVIKTCVALRSPLGYLRLPRLRLIHIHE